MKNLSFADNQVVGFFFSSKRRVMTLSFDYLVADGSVRNGACELRIHAKQELLVDASAYSKIKHDSRIGVVTLLLDIEKKEDRLLLEVMTADDRYLRLTFVDAEVAIMIGEVGGWEIIPPEVLRA